MSQVDPDSKITVEDLLSLKRAERPGPEFWANFESELRQKQLTALVQKRHWWHDLPVMFNRRIYLPAGAAAIVAFALVSVRYAAPARVAQVPHSAAEIAAVDAGVETLAATVVPASALVQAGSRDEPVMIAPSAASSATATHEAVAAVPATPALGDAETISPRAAVASLTRLVQPDANLLEPFLDSRLGSPGRMQPASDPQAEVAAMTTASASKYRLIARYVDRSLSPAPAAPAVVRERLARRLGDDLNDGISRIGVVGDRVSLKF